MAYYTYFHTRSDTNTVFYIGKGSGKRAYSKSSRNKYWKSIVSKHGYSVSIASVWSTEKEAFEHEAFLISCFRGIGLTLANYTDGGDGRKGCTHSGETRRKMSESASVRASSTLSRQRLSEVGKLHTITKEAREKLHSKELLDKLSGSLRAAWQDPDKRARMLANRKQRRDYA